MSNPSPSLGQRLRSKTPRELARSAWAQLFPRRHRPQAVDSPEQRMFLRDGVLVLPDLIPPDVIAEANAAIDRALVAGRNAVTGQAIFEKPRGVVNIPAVLTLAPVFRELMSHPRLMPHLLSTIGSRAKMFQAQALIYPPRVGFFNAWHSDLVNRMPYIDLSRTVLYVKAIFYLTDVRQDGGAFTYLRGSHRHAPRRDFSALYDGLLRRHKTLVAEGRAGTVVLFHTSGFHRVQPNVTRDRRTLTYTYTHFWARGNYEAPELGALDPEELTPIQKHMLGFRLDREAAYTQLNPAFTSLDGGDQPSYHH